MGRAPCCEKMGLKRGPWSPEEDQILITHINTYGHSNWRALPKQAGLLRCGKSCRLRWTNYLRPDIKRGNFTKEEEDGIINLHEMLGNRWSAIAAKLPGRTDNEIKNVWHTHLKKRLRQNQQSDHKNNLKRNKREIKLDTINASKSNQDVKQEQQQYLRPQSPPHEYSSSEASSLNSKANIGTNYHHDMYITKDNNHEINSLALDEDFWSEVLSSDNSNETMTSTGVLDSSTGIEEGVLSDTSFMSLCNDMDFWHDVYAGAEEIELNFYNFDHLII